MNTAINLADRVEYLSRLVRNKSCIINKYDDNTYKADNNDVNDATDNEYSDEMFRVMCQEYGTGSKISQSAIDSTTDTITFLNLHSANTTNVENNTLRSTSIQSSQTVETNTKEENSQEEHTNENRISGHCTAYFSKDDITEVTTVGDRLAVAMSSVYSLRILECSACMNISPEEFLLRAINSMTNNQQAA